MYDMVSESVGMVGLLRGCVGGVLRGCVTEGSAA